jgi:hypothetical protein
MLVGKHLQQLLEVLEAAANHADTERCAGRVDAPHCHRLVHEMVAVALAEYAHEEVVVLVAHELGVEAAYRLERLAAHQRRRRQHEHVVAQQVEDAALGMLCMVLDYTRADDVAVTVCFIQVGIDVAK